MSNQTKPRVLAIVGPHYAGKDYIEAFQAEYDLDVRVIRSYYELRNMLRQ